MNKEEAKEYRGKLNYCLVPRMLLTAVARIREYGNRKYEAGGPDNWKNVDPQRWREAAFRHFLAYLDDPLGLDEESGLPHLWHLACNVAFLCELDKPIEPKQVAEKNCRTCHWIGEANAPCMACEKHDKWVPVFYEEEQHG